MKRHHLAAAGLVALSLAGLACLPPAPRPAPRPPAPAPAPAPTPRPPPAPAPVGPVDWSPIRKIIAAGDRRQAAEVATAWRGLAWALARGDALGTPIKTTGDLRRTITAFEHFAFRGGPLGGSFPGLSAALTAGVQATLGPEDRDLQPGEAAAAITAAAEACTP